MFRTITILSLAYVIGLITAMTLLAKLPWGLSLTSYCILVFCNLLPVIIAYMLSRRYRSPVFLVAMLIFEILFSAMVGYIVYALLLPGAEGDLGLSFLYFPVVGVLGLILFSLIALASQAIIK